MYVRPRPVLKVPKVSVGRTLSAPNLHNSRNGLLRGSIRPENTSTSATFGTSSSSLAALAVRPMSHIGQVQEGAATFLSQDAEQALKNGAVILQQQHILARLRRIRVFPSATDDNRQSTTLDSASRAKIATLKEVKGSVLAERRLLNAELATELATKLADLGVADEAIRVLQLALEGGIPVDISVYRTVAKGLKLKKDWECLKALLPLSEQHLGRTSFRLLEDYARALVMMHDYPSLRKILPRYAQADTTPSMVTYSLLLRAHLENCDRTSAIRVLDHMQSNGIEPNQATRTSFLLGASRLGLTPFVRKVLVDFLTAPLEPSAITGLNAALKLCITAGDVKTAKAVLKRIDLQARDGRSPHAKSYLVPPDDTTFVTLMDLYAQQGEITRVTDVLGVAMSRGIAPTSAMVNVLIRAYLTAGDVPSAIAILKLLLHNEPSSSITTDLVEQIQHDLSSLDAPPPTKHSPNLLINHHITIRTSHIVPFIRFAIANNRKDGLINSLRLAHHLNLPFTLQMYQALRRYRYGTASIARLPQFLLKKLPSERRRRTYRLDDNLNALRALRVRNQVRSLSAASRGSGARSFRRRGPDRLSPRMRNWLPRSVLSGDDSHTFTLQLRHNALVQKDMRAAIRTLRMMKQRGIPTRAHHFAAIMEGYAATGRFKLAKLWMKRFEVSPLQRVANKRKNSQLDPPGDNTMRSLMVPLGVGSVVLWTILIVGYGRIGRTDQARRTMEEMISEGVKPDAKAVNALVNAYVEKGDMRGARSALVDFWPADLSGPLTAEVRKLPLKKLLKAMWTNSAQQSSLPGDPQPRRGFTMKESLELSDSVNKIVRTWKGTLDVQKTPAKAVDLSDLPRPPSKRRRHSRSSPSAAVPLEGRSNHRYPAKPWAEREP